MICRLPVLGADRYRLYQPRFHCPSREEGVSLDPGYLYLKVRPAVRLEHPAQVARERQVEGRQMIILYQNDLDPSDLVPV